MTIVDKSPIYFYSRVLLMKRFSSLFTLPSLSATLLVTSLGSLLSGCVIHIDGPASFSSNDEHFSKQLSLSAAGISELLIHAESGDMEIKGVAGLDTITVAAKVWTSSKPESDVGYNLILVEDGDKARLTATQKPRDGFYFGSSAKIDLIVSMPAYMALSVDDESGDIVISDVKGGVKIEDQSGDIEVAHLTHHLRINDESGDINIHHVDGDINIHDDSGEIEISHVSGEVFIDDASGDITVSHVDNIVKIDDGSGDIEINRVKTLKILESGSGELNVREGS